MHANAHFAEILSKSSSFLITKLSLLISICYISFIIPEVFNIKIF